MLNLFKRYQDGAPTARDGSPGATLASHILPKFCKRLRARQHPHILDLGPLCGSNIEFFARIGCKVQVEDLQAAIGTATPAEDPPAAAPEAMPDIAMAQAPRVLLSPGLPVAREVAPVQAARPGGRPTRRIVVPPRTFPGRPGPGPHGAGIAGVLRRPANQRGGAERTPLPTDFAYPDATFDAVVAWDLFNYYDPESARRVAGEARRVLKPGGLIFGYFHAGRGSELDGPCRYRISDETTVESAAPLGRRLARHLYQNRDIEKMFTGLRIVELYFLRNSLREILMEKKVEPAIDPEPPSLPALPEPRFRIE